MKKAMYLPFALSQSYWSIAMERTFILHIGHTYEVTCGTEGQVNSFVDMMTKSTMF